MAPTYAITYIKYIKSSLKKKIIKIDETIEISWNIIAQNEFGDKKTSIWQIKSKVAKKAFSLNIKFSIKRF